MYHQYVPSGRVSPNFRPESPQVVEKITPWPPPPDFFGSLLDGASEPNGNVTYQETIRMDADIIRYMQIQSENDSQSVKAVKWQFCGLVTLSLNHTAIADGIQGALGTLFNYCQYLIETGQ